MTVAAPSESRPPGKLLIFALAAAAGIAAANMYYNQPLLGVMTQEFPDSSVTRMIPPITQVGFALGMFLLVPLGDLMDRRRLIVIQFSVLALALAAAALAPNAVVLVVASLMVGACSSAAQQIVPFAASMATEKSRGKILGTVMGGLLSGLLLSRTLAGFVGDHYGWRTVFWLGVPLVLFAAVLMRGMLPRDTARSDLSYVMALRSLAHLWRSEPLLRGAAMVQACIFAAFSAFWSVLALHLQDFGLGPDAAGLFGIVGLVGVLAAPVAGRLSDRRGPQIVVTLGAGLVFFSWIIFAVWNQIAGLVVGVIILDFGVQSAMVSNQHVIYALRPDARNRLNTLFMTSIFLGGAVGSAGAVASWSAAGWMGVCAFAAAVSLMALVAIIFNKHIRMRASA